MSRDCFNYAPDAETVSACLAIFDRGMERFEKSGMVVAHSRQKKQANRGAKRKRLYTKHHPMPEEVRQRIAKRYMGSETLLEIAASEGCSVATIQKITVDLHLVTRAFGGKH